MTDADLDADIERMLTVHRNRKTLGFQYYETQGTRSRQSNEERRKQPPRAGKPNWRVKYVRYTPTPEALERDADELEKCLKAALARAPYTPTEILMGLPTVKPLCPLKLVMTENQRVA